MLPVSEVSKKTGSDVGGDSRGQRGQIAVGLSLHLQLCLLLQTLLDTTRHRSPQERCAGL